jgi:hypothetical protein
MNQIGENDLEAPRSFVPHTQSPPPDSIVLMELSCTRRRCGNGESFQRNATEVATSFAPSRKLTNAE